MTSNPTPERPTLCLAYTVPPGETPGHMMLGEAVGPDDTMKLLWADDVWVDVDDEGDLDLETFFNDVLRTDFGLTVTSPWRYKIEYYEADCVVSTPMPENDLTVP